MYSLIVLKNERKWNLYVYLPKEWNRLSHKEGFQLIDEEQRRLVLHAIIVNKGKDCFSLVCHSQSHLL